MKHKTFLIPLALMLAFLPATVSRAQPATLPATTPLTRPAGPDIEKLTLHPSAATRPAAKDHLLPDLADQTPGDAVPLYLMARRFWPDAKTTSDSLYPENHKYDYLDTPIDQFPKPYAERLLAGYGQTLAYADAAARRRDAEWDVWVKAPTIASPFTYLNDLRHVLNLLSFRIMYEVSQRDWDAARHSMQTQFSIGHQLAAEPTVVNSLVASACIEVALYHGVSEWIAREGSPNLYWALTDLPRPFIDLRSLPQWELVDRRRWNPQFFQAMHGQLPPQQWRQVLHEIVGRLHEYNRLPEKTDPAEIDRKLKSLMDAARPRARAYQVAQGTSKEIVDAMPAEQAVGMYWCQEYQAAADDLWKSWTLPYWQAEDQMMRSWRALRPDQSPASDNPLIQANLVSEDGYGHVEQVPSVLRMRYQITRGDQYLALMRTIEAVRDYAAHHDGQPPQRLDQITDLPLPTNPLTGKPFDYRLDGRVATIDAPSPIWRGPRSGWRYELTFIR